MNDETLKADDLADIDDDDNANFLKAVKNVGYADPKLEMEMMEEVLLQYRGTGKRVVISHSNVIGSYAFANDNIGRDRVRTASKKNFRQRVCRLYQFALDKI